MNIQECPRCGQDSFATTGAFWTCSACRISITSQALSRDQQHRKFSAELTTYTAAPKSCVTV